MSALMDLLNVLWEPGAVFERVREKPRIWEPLVAILVLQVVLTAVLLSFARPVMEAAIQQAMQARGGAAGAMPGSAGVFLGIGVVVQGIIFGVILVFGAGVLWVLTSIIAGEAKFGTLLSVTAYTSILFVLQLAVSIIVLMARGRDSLTSPQDLQVALGLDILVPGAKGFVGGLLKGINPFAIVGSVLTGIGVSVTHRVSRGMGYSIAFAAFVVMLLVASAFAGACSGRMGG